MTRNLWIDTAADEILNDEERMMQLDTMIQSRITERREVDQVNTPTVGGAINLLASDERITGPEMVAMQARHGIA